MLPASHIVCGGLPLIALALAAPALTPKWLYSLSGSPIVADLPYLTLIGFYGFTMVALDALVDHLVPASGRQAN
jgi:hypothetical protein